MSLNTTPDWSETGRGVKFFFFDWYLFVPLFILIFDVFNIYIYIFEIILFILSFYLNFIGYNLGNFLRFVQVKLIKKKASGRPKWFMRKYIS